MKSTKTKSAKPRMSKTERAMRAAFAKAKAGDKVKVYGVGLDHIRIIGVIEALHPDGTALINLGTQTCVLDLDDDGKADPKCWRTDNWWHEAPKSNSTKPQKSKTERAMRAAFAKAKAGDKVMVWGVGPHDGVITQLNSDGTALVSLGIHSFVLNLHTYGKPDPKFWRTHDFS